MTTPAPRNFFHKMLEPAIVVFIVSGGVSICVLVVNVQITNGNRLFSLETSQTATTGRLTTIEADVRRINDIVVTVPAELRGIRDNQLAAEKRDGEITGRMIDSIRQMQSQTTQILLNQATAGATRK